MHELDLPESLPLREVPPGRGVLFALEENRTGVLRLLQTLYPGGTTSYARDAAGHVIASFYQIPPELIHSSQLRAERFSKSRLCLQGVYRLSLDPQSPASLIHDDPLLNFTFRNDFPLRLFPPLTVDWSGFLSAPRTGLYRFVALATDAARVRLDGQWILSGDKMESPELLLNKGLHPIHVTFQKSSGTDAALSLLWKKPGDSKYEVIPNTAFRMN